MAGCGWSSSKGTKHRGGGPGETLLSLQVLVNLWQADSNGSLKPPGPHIVILCAPKVLTKKLWSSLRFHRLQRRMTQHLPATIQRKSKMQPAEPREPPLPARKVRFWGGKIVLCPLVPPATPMPPLPVGECCVGPAMARPCERGGPLFVKALP